MNIPSVLFFSIVGGFSVNLIRLFGVLNDPTKKTLLKDIKIEYWLQFAIVPLIGGFVAYAYSTSGAVLSPILAINIGASAPAILTSFAKSTPTISIGDIN